MAAAALWILEDDEKLCGLLAEQCERHQWSLRPFHDPRSFEAALEGGVPDLLLLDQLLPGKNGMDVLARLRRAGHRFPVLMLSALGAPTDRIAGLEAGADDYMAKPFHFRELQLRIARLLSSREGTATLPPPPGTLCIDSLRFDPRNLVVRGVGDEESTLSRGDAALLLALCRRAGAVVSREALVRATGSLVDPSQSRTIDVRLSRLRRVLAQLNGGRDPIESLRGRGYRLEAVVREQAGEG